MNNKNIRIVLVETSHSGNIGAVARAMKNMGLSQLYLVQPRSALDEVAIARAAGAKDLLQQAIICESLAIALQDCHWTFACSARRRCFDIPMFDVKQAVHKIATIDTSQQIALVFGRESAGLSNQELNLCQIMIQIPANPEYPVLNLAMAVQIIAYELFCYQMEATPYPKTAKETTVNDMELFYAHLEATLTDLAFLDPKQPKQLLLRLRQLFNRAEPNQIELNILRGILTSAQRVYKQHQQLELKQSNENET